MITSNNNFVINLFAYADCNPLANIDPTGTCPYNGTKADFINLELGLPSMDCDCLNISLGTGLSYTNDLFSFGTDVALDYAQYANDTSVRPPNIGVGSYNKYITSQTKLINNISNTFSSIFYKLSYFFVLVEAIETNCNNNSNESCGKIIWDVVVDFTISSANVYFATEIGAMVGSAIPIPVLGTVIGAAVGFGFGILLDRFTEEPKKIIKSWVK